MWCTIWLRKLLSPVGQWNLQLQAKSTTRKGCLAFWVRVVGFLVNYAYKVGCPPCPFLLNWFASFVIAVRTSIMMTAIFRWSTVDLHDRLGCTGPHWGQPFTWRQADLGRRPPELRSSASYGRGGHLFGICWSAEGANLQSPRIQQSCSRLPLFEFRRICHGIRLLIPFPALLCALSFITQCNKSPPCL